MNKRALITGITGQDGAYLTDLLVQKGYEVHGMKRRSSQPDTTRLVTLFGPDFEKGLPVHMHIGDMQDGASLMRIIYEVQPDEIYNLAAQTELPTSHSVPEYTIDVNVTGVVRILETIKSLGWKDRTRFFQASSSAMYGNPPTHPQNEETLCMARDPYGLSKYFSHLVTSQYREIHGLFACSGILFNHLSPLIKDLMLPRKVTKAAASIALGLQKKVELGNLNAVRDWGNAKDFIYAMWLMLQAGKPDHYVLATGRNCSVRHVCEVAFYEAGIPIEWTGEGVNEKGINAKTGEVVITINSELFRISEVDSLLGDITKIKAHLDWQPELYIDGILKEMVAFDLREAKKEIACKGI